MTTTQIDAALAADASLARMDQEQARKSVWSTTKYIAEVPGPPSRAPCHGSATKLLRNDVPTQTHAPTHTQQTCLQGLENEFVSEPKTYGDGLSVRAQLWKRVRQMHMKEKMQEASEVEKKILNNLRMLAEVSTVATGEYHMHLRNDALQCVYDQRHKCKHVHTHAAARG